jgi:type II secretory pathway pseudopilin PulG
LQDGPLGLSSLRPHRRRERGAFTLVELLIVIGIIVVLIGILLPVVSKIRRAAQAANTKNFVAELGGAIDRYQTDFRAYPGPLSNNEMDIADIGTTYTPGGYPTFGFPASAPGFDITSQSASQAGQHFTMSENLVLGLLGGLHADTTISGQLDYDPSAVGGGPYSLNTVGTPKRYSAYLDDKQLSWRNGSAGRTGQYQDDAASANDSLIPEFVDSFPDAMPILYMRAKVGANPTPPTPGVAGLGYTAPYNPVITDDFTASAKDGSGNSAPRAGQYDLSQIIAYTGAYTGTWPSLTIDSSASPAGASIGVGKSQPSTPPYTNPTGAGGIYHGLRTVTYSAAPSLASQFPYDAYPYLIGSTGTAREKDAYILISAGPDRIYGTSDDICNFGIVGQ